MNSSDDLTPNNNKTHLWVWFWLKTTRAKPWLARAYSRLCSLPRAIFELADPPPPDSSHNGSFAWQ